ncbi:MAG TPA: pyrroloquinoline quinone biosynthesis peptide chaperone PqqD [Terriglobales bacterium]|nr:pyrroloquinoline quinone biosynthesis peptide chaperone PqqD [Terriglobales bacterium]
MATIENSSQPRLAVGCRWAEASGPERMLLFPEGAIRLQGTGRAILEYCDGRRTVQQIVEEMQNTYTTADPVRIHQEVATFLQQLYKKRIVDF